MLKIVSGALFFFYFVALFADSMPEFDGGYLKTQKGNIIELNEIKIKTTDIMTNDTIKSVIAPNAEKSYLGYYSMKYVLETGNFQELGEKEFKGIVVKGQYDFKQLTLHPLLSLSTDTIISFRRVAVDRKTAPIRKWQPFFVPGNELKLRRKSLNEDIYYFEPRSKLENGEYALQLNDTFWVFKLIYKLPHSIQKIKSIENLYKIIHNMPDNSSLGFHMKGQTYACT